MATPTATKTWQYDLNQTYASTGTPLTDLQQTLRGMKNRLLAFAAHAPTVRGSSDGTTAALDNTDRWTANNKLIWASPGTAHSWLVLRFADIAANYELCLDLTPLEGSTQGTKLTIVVSPGAAFTGGSTTARPTATDEFVSMNGLPWCGQNAASASFTSVSHLMLSNDGQALYWRLYIANVCVGFWGIGKAQDPISGWTKPSHTLTLGASTASDNVLTHAKLWSAAPAKGYIGSTTASFYLASLGYAGQQAGQREVWANDLSAEWQPYSIVLISETAPVRGQMTGVTPGTRGIWDLWYGSSVNGSPTTYFPGDGTKTFVQCGALIFPNNGTTLATA